jgi:integrase
MLTDADCRNASCPAGAKRARLTDGAGLYLEVSPTGRRRWFWKFYPEGKESRLQLGLYPAMGLKAARSARDEAKRAWRAGQNPVQARRVAKLSAQISSANTFELVARDFHATKAEGWSESYGRRWLERLSKDLFPQIGTLPISEVKAPLLLQALRKVERRGAIETAHTLRQTAGQVFKFGVQTGKCEHNPAGDLGGALKPVQVTHMAALLEPAKVADLMRAIDGYHGQPTTRAALLLSALLFQRPGNIRAMEWQEVDLDGGLWTIPAAKMKRRKSAKVNGRPHLVPLAAQALEVLRELVPLTGAGRFVFPALQGGDKCMSENTVNTALRRLGFSSDEMTAHGFRATARTLMVERLPGVMPDVIEAQLAHDKSGPLGAAYDRAEFMEQRRALMRLWADYLYALKAGAKVLPFKVA